MWEDLGANINSGATAIALARLSIQCAIHSSSYAILNVT
jgi:hypothetical protein